MDQFSIVILFEDKEWTVVLHKAQNDLLNIKRRLDYNVLSLNPPRTKFLLQSTKFCLTITIAAKLCVRVNTAFPQLITSNPTFTNK